MSGYNTTRTITKIDANPALSNKRDTNRKMRVAAYCRVSTDMEDQLNSLETQMQYYTAKIAENPNWIMAGIYPDEGITGTKTDKREQFLKLMRDCEKGKIDYILTKSTSRFARNTVDSLTWIRKLRTMGIGIYFEEQNLDSLKAENETLLGFFSVMAQSESESISANVKWGIQKRMMNGTYKIRYDSFGLSEDKDGNPIIVQDQADVLRTLCRMLLDGASLGRLKNYLETNHIKTKEGKDTWSISAIRYMLSNEKIAGDVMFQKTYCTDCISKKKKVNRGEITRYLISNNHPAIIDRETFNLVQAELARRNNTLKKIDSGITEQGKYSAKYALSELLICGSCGSFYRRTSKVAQGKTTYYWRCIGRIEHGREYCKDSSGIEEKNLHAAICRGLSKMIENSGEVLALIQSNLMYAVSGNNAALDMYAIERQMNQLKKDISDITELAAKTEGDPERYEIELKKLFDQLVSLRSQLDCAKAQAEQSDTANAEVKRILDILKNTEMNFSEYNDITIRRLVECIQVVGNQKIIITLKGGYQVEEELIKIATK